MEGSPRSASPQPRHRRSSPPPSAYARLTKPEAEEAGVFCEGMPRPQWVPDAKRNFCASCKGGFSVMHRKHHCRGCGEIFCSQCSRFKGVLPASMKYGHGVHRMCEACYQKSQKTYTDEVARDEEVAAEEEEEDDDDAIAGSGGEDGSAELLVSAESPLPDDAAAASETHEKKAFEVRRSSSKMDTLTVPSRNARGGDSGGASGGSSPGQPVMLMEDLSTRSLSMSCSAEPSQEAGGTSPAPPSNADIGTSPENDAQDAEEETLMESNEMARQVTLSASPKDESAVLIGAQERDGSGEPKEQDEKKKGSSETEWRSRDAALRYYVEIGNEAEVRRHVRELNVDVNAGEDVSDEAPKKKPQREMPDDVYYRLHPDVSGDTPMHIAAASGQVEMIKLLFFLDAKVDSQNRVGSTPLHRAVSNGHIEAVRELLRLGAKIHAKNTIGQTPLHVAVSVHNLEMIQFLIKNGAREDLYVMNVMGLVPIQYTLPGSPDRQYLLSVDKELGLFLKTMAPAVGDASESTDHAHEFKSSHSEEAI